jgi:hypothetical protein
VSVVARPGAVVPADACAAFDQPGLDGAITAATTVHAAPLATPAGEFAAVARVEGVIASLGPA